jgi:hypothetical protein
VPLKEQVAPVFCAHLVKPAGASVSAKALPQARTAMAKQSLRNIDFPSLKIKVKRLTAESTYREER